MQGRHVDLTGTSDLLLQIRSCDHMARVKETMDVGMAKTATLSSATADPGPGQAVIEEIH